MTAVFPECHRICQTRLELSQQCSVFHIRYVVLSFDEIKTLIYDWLLKYVNSSVAKIEEFFKYIFMNMNT